MSNLSYEEALHGVVADEDVEGVVGLVHGHKNWGAFRARLPSHIVVNLVDEIKRLRERVGGYKQVPDIDVKAFDPAD